MDREENCHQESKKKNGVYIQPIGGIQSIGEGDHLQHRFFLPMASCYFLDPPEICSGGSRDPWEHGSGELQQEGEMAEIRSPPFVRSELFPIYTAAV